MAKALELWSLEAIEETLGADADAALPSSLRLTDVHVRLPRHHVAMLEHFADRDRTTVSGVLTRELDGIASVHSDQLSWEGLYEADRGFTFTVATEAAIWEAAVDAKGPHVRPLFEAHLAAYEYVLNLGTSREPVTEKVIRTLHMVAPLPGRSGTQ